MHPTSTGQFLIAQLNAIHHDLSLALSQCDHGQYSMPLLSGSSIGEHIRHIVDFFQCIASAIPQSTVNYDLRERDRQIETNKDFALSFLYDLIQLFNKPNVPIQLVIGKHASENIIVESNLFREIAYNIEHAIHHMAIIKIGLHSLNIEVDKHFGVASSTIKYRKQCAS